jgi:hypothetical protein
MGLTFKLGTIPLAILTDASNNVGIGGSPSGSYKLEVTGTAKVSSTLLVGGASTFSSAITINQNQNATSTSTFSNSDTTNTNSRQYIDIISGSRTLSLRCINGDNTYLASNGGSIQLQPNNSTALTLASTGAATFSSTLATASRGITTGSMPVGSVIQTVSYTMAGGFSTSSGSDQDTGLKLSITPTSSTSKILVIITINGRVTAGGGNCYINCKLVKGAFDTGTTLYNGYAILGSFNATDLRGTINISYLDSPATTSSTQYVISMNSQFGSAVYVNSTTTPSTITLMEIAQ